MSIESEHTVMDQRAFPVLPNSDRYFSSASSEDARRRLTLCVERGDGPAMLVGAAGCGKTMILEVLTKQFAQSFRVVRLASTQLCTRRALLQAILYGLKKPYRAHDEGELRISLLETLNERPFELPPVVLLVDEAQGLPVRLLEELRLLTNHAVDGVPRLMLVLAGTSTLDEAFTAPELETFNQRLMARCYLSPLSAEETTQYVRAHIAVAGENPEQLIDDSAYRSVFLASDGVPRLINQVCDRALLMAVEQNIAKIDADTIQAAWSDLHQLPAPWHTPTATSPIVQEPSELSTGFEAFENETDAVSFSPSDDLVAAETTELELSEMELTEGASTIEFVQDEDLSNEALLAPLLEQVKAETEEPEISTVPVWNADQALADLPLQPQAGEQEEYELAEEDEDEGCIAYTFPTRPEEPATWTGNDSSTDLDAPAATESFEASSFELDDIEMSSFETGGFELARSTFRADQFDPQEPNSSEEPASDSEGLANNPFDEQFDEEEIVLDRFTEIEAIIPNDGHKVTNHQELEFGNMFQALTPAVESLLDDVTQKIERYNNSLSFGIVGDTPQLAQEPAETNWTTETSWEADETPLTTDDAVTSLSTDDSDLLIVEDLDFAPETAVAETSSQVHRKEYGQLFASLREG